MDLSPKKDIYHIYEMEAQSFNSGRVDFFWKNVLQAGGVFVFMTFVVFFMINFRFISSQMADWYNVRDYGIATDLSMNSNYSQDVYKYFISKNDSDGDGLNNDLEEIIGTDFDKTDSDEDGYSDFQEFSNGYGPLGAGLLKAEIIIKDKSAIPVTWESGIDKNSEEISLIDNSEKIIFNNTIKLPLDYIQASHDRADIKVMVYLPDGNKIEGVYKEKTKEVSHSSSEINSFKEGIQLISGWPSGTDWQRLIINAELVSLRLIK